MYTKAAPGAAALLVLLSFHTRRLLADSPAPTIAANPPVFLDDDDDDKPKAVTLPTTTATAASTPATDRHFLGLLDPRSSYGNDFFHDPFIGPEFDSERQIQFDWAHAEGSGSRSDEVDGGFQWNVVGQWTVAAQFGWDSEKNFGLHTGSAGDDTTRRGTSGLESVDLAVYHPVFQFVSADKFIDYTAAVRLDVGIPTRTPASPTDVQLTPYLGQLLRIGDHISLEAWTGPQITLGPRQTNYFLYGVSCGYIIPHRDLPIPLTESLTPIAEIDGKTPFSGNSPDALFGVAGFDAGFHALGPAEPHLEIGFQFPLDQGARTQLHWGVVAELFVQF